jgi:hypothetical protein
MYVSVNEVVGRGGVRGLTVVRVPIRATFPVPEKGTWVL